MLMSAARKLKAQTRFSSTNLCTNKCICFGLRKEENRARKRKHSPQNIREQNRRQSPTLHIPNTEPINFLLFHQIKFRSPLPSPNPFRIFVMMKTRQPRIRKSSRPSWTLTLTLLITCCFLVLILLTLRILSVSNANSSTSLSKPNDLSSISRTSHVSEEDDNQGERWVEIISWEPRAFLYHNFLTKEECDYLINIAKPDMQKSAVVDSKTGKSMDSRVRTSSGAFLARGRDHIVRDIEKRIADFTFIPVEHGEGLQVLHYEVGQKYEPHLDYFMDDVNTKNGGQRIATMLMYLSDVEEGGETVFPNAKGNVSSVPWWNELSECAKKGLSIKPKMGNALLFWSMKPDATLDPLSLHGGCPVIKGNKWSCTKWMRLKPYDT